MGWTKDRRKRLQMAIHCLRGVLARLEITVTEPEPGFVRTDMTSGSKVTPPLSVEESVANILRRLGL